MKSQFSYLIDKIDSAPISTEPFRHIHIADFFSPEDFAAIIAGSQITLPRAEDDSDLFDKLFAAGYRVIEFPGCITDKRQYLRWHSGRGSATHHTACEGFGMTLRMTEPHSDILRNLRDFLASDEFNTAIARRFGIDLADCTVDGGIQKYLDGYEISPHPDIRRKAATFMVNINPGEGSEAREHHTHYMKFKPERSYVQSFWEGNEDVDRCWVPWDWCETMAEQRDNNSIVIFSPSNDTLHAVKARYPHLDHQRTQLYGNLWYKEDPAEKDLRWEKFELTKTQRIPLRDTIKEAVPKELLKKAAALRDQLRRANYKTDRNISRR